MSKPQDWPNQLAQYLATYKDTPFQWGKNDCCTFALNWHALMTGKAFPMPEYTTALSAARALSKMGGLQAAALTYFKTPINNPLMGRRGDIALVNMGADGAALAVVTDIGTMAPGADGLMALPLAEAIFVWRV